MKNSIYLCQSIIKISYQNMKQVRFEFEELPYDTLSQFGLTREMIEDLPMQTLEEISHGRHSPVLPIKVNDENVVTVKGPKGELTKQFKPAMKITVEDNDIHVTRPDDLKEITFGEIQRGAEKAAPIRKDHPCILRDG